MSNYQTYRARIDNNVKLLTGGQAMQAILHLTIFAVLFLTSDLTFATPRCDLSSDEPNECLIGKLRTAESLNKERTAALVVAIGLRIREDDSASERFREAIRISDQAWRKSKDANCSITEAAFFDGSGRINAVLECELEENELRNARLARLQKHFGLIDLSVQRSISKK